MEISLDNWINKLSPEHCFELERWQGLPNIIKVIECETVSFNVIQMISLLLFAVLLLIFW